jgi:hypothetical protein
LVLLARQLDDLDEEIEHEVGDAGDILVEDLQEDAQLGGCKFD